MDTGRVCVRRALIFLAVTVGMAGALYPGRFRVWADPVSALGMAASVEGLPNAPGMLVFGLGCWGTAGCLVNAWRHTGKIGLLLAAIGMAALPIPADLYPFAHQLAAACLVGGLYFFCTFFLALHYRKTALFIYLQASILVYAVAHVLGAETKEELQTFAVVGLVLTLIDYAWMGRDRFAPRPHREPEWTPPFFRLH
jgi:hypothetical protein